MTNASGRRIRRDHASHPSVETLESRELLTSGAGAFTEFGDSYGFASSVVSGQDGNLYVANSGYNGAASITKFAPDGTLLANDPLPSHEGAYGIASGTDGEIWVIEQSKIALLTPDGRVTEYAIKPSNLIGNSSIVAGPDGSAYFIDNGTIPVSITIGSALPPVASPPSIGRIDPDGTITYFPVLDGTPSALATGSDGSAYFVDRLANGSATIDWLDADGTLTQFPMPDGLNNPSSLTIGPDGALWFLDLPGFAVNLPGNPQAPAVGRLDPSGSVTSLGFHSPGDPGNVDVSDDSGLVSAPDGNLYFLDNGAIGQVTPAGIVTEATVPLSVFRSGDTIGPDGNLWIAIDNLPTEPGLARYSLDEADAGSEDDAETGFVPPPASASWSSSTQLPTVPTATAPVTVPFPFPSSIETLVVPSADKTTSTLSTSSRPAPTTQSASVPTGLSIATQVSLTISVDVPEETDLVVPAKARSRQGPAYPTLVTVPQS